LKIILNDSDLTKVNCLF